MKFELGKMAIAAVTAFGIAAGVSAARAADKDIVDTAVAAGQFNTLAAALTAAGLVETLKGEGPFTVFAPTDAAFAALPAGAVDGLLKDVPQLKAVLTYHVVDARVSAFRLLRNLGGSITMFNGKQAAVTWDRGIKVDGARVVLPNVPASNGLIHVVSSVLLP